ncbi:MAG: aminotransferase class V-fold PLP-dependent enzyme [Campylobacteraceae bacterium]|jgi:O-acetylhomoserine (thiol)-lyase|nr:aminotransferase class V-fold PLP-dependent enzyme [Campylobacteraceae bacterium]
MAGFITKALHTRSRIKDANGALRMPVYENAAFEFDTAEAIDDVSVGKSIGHVYTRSSNPTVEHFELSVKNLTNSLGVMAFGSGMAAIATAVLTLVKAGESIITTKYLFGHTLSFFQNTLTALGINVKFVDISDENVVERSFDTSVKLIFLESISNPQLQVANLEKLAELSHTRNIPLVVDTTPTPFYMFEAKKFGVDIEVLSSTKFISGGGTSVGGLLIDNGIFDWKKTENLKSNYAKAGHFAFLHKARKEIFQGFGAVLSPTSAYLQTLGLETMALRIDRACENALELASWLEGKKGIKSVNYPFLKSSPFYEIAKKQFKYAGSILSIELESKSSAYRFMNRLKIIRRATNIHDNKSLIVSPYFVIYPFNSHEEKTALDITPGLLRLSVGIENIEDLKEDIEQALGG